MKIALAQINPTVGDFAINRAKIIAQTQEARSLGCHLVVFPELALSGYPLRDLVERPSFLRQNAQALQTLVKELEAIPDIAVIVGSLTTGQTPGNKPYNSAVFIRNGRIEFIQSKRLLPTYDVFDEHRNFTSADDQRVCTFMGECIGITICEDIWNSHKYWNNHHQLDPYRVDPVTELVRQGAEIIINISASPYHTNKIIQRYELAKGISLDHKVPLVYVNTVGGNDHLVFDGNSFVCCGNGQIVAQAKSFEEDLITFNTENNLGSFSDYGDSSPMHELNSALVLGTRDYVRKCGFSKVVIGLSGGIDSAVVAAIAVQALGAENVTGIAMPSSFSSTGSVDDAVALAHNLGIELLKIPIHDTKISLINQFHQTGRSEFTEEPNHLFIYNPLKITGLADENMQARIRGTILMTYSNQFGALVLSTGNKSEVAVGYCTLYGDMCGGLSVISDVPKTKVYELARWINKNLLFGSFDNPIKYAIPAATITKPPSAELAPDQKDTDSLPPYEVLDRILEEYIEHNVPMEQIANDNGIDFKIVSRIVNLIERNEYKRQQAAPGIKVTPKAFGQGRRFPIARKI